MSRFLLLAFSAMIATSAAGSNIFEKSEICLYQTNDVLERRMPDAAKIADYIVQLQSVCQSFLAKDKTPETLDVVVAVRPGRLSRIWFVSSIGSENDPRRRLLRKKLEAVKPIKVTGGPVAFTFVARIAGGDGKARNGIPMPKEWQDAATKGQCSRS
jgi:hypothetical protein